MAHPTDHAVTLIKDYVNTNISGGFGNSDIYLIDRLNDTHFSGNSVSQGYVYNTFNANTIFSLISSSSVKTLLNIPSMNSDVLPLLNKSPHEASDIYLLNTWAQAYELGGVITPSEYVSVTGVVNSLQPDSSWSSGVSWASVYLNRSVDINDIQSCR